jgi:hypothetical protein
MLYLHLFPKFIVFNISTPTGYIRNERFARHLWGIVSDHRSPSRSSPRQRELCRCASADGLRDVQREIYIDDFGEDSAVQQRA